MEPPLEATLMEEILRDFSGEALPPTPPSLRRHRVPGATLPEAAFVEEDLEWLSNKDAFPTLDTFDISAPGRKDAVAKRPSPVSVLEGGFLQRARTKGRRRRRRVLPVFRPAEGVAPREKRRCWHCEAEETPQWRAGPAGPKTLCNACGVRYKSGRLVPEYRPANSPTFSSDLHSNSHRKIMEMRRRKDVPIPTAAATAAAVTKEMRRKKRRRKKGGAPSPPINLVL